MACCGGGKKSFRVQISPQLSPEKVNLKPLSTMRVFVNNQRTNTQDLVTVQKADANVVKKDSTKCPMCGHPTMIQKVGGRSRLQCTNFSCRAVV